MLRADCRSSARDARHAQDHSDRFCVSFLAGHLGLAVCACTRCVARHPFRVRSLHGCPPICKLLHCNLQVAKHVMPSCINTCHPPCQGRNGAIVARRADQPAAFQPGLGAGRGRWTEGPFRAAVWHRCTSQACTYHRTVKIATHTHIPAQGCTVVLLQISACCAV